LDAITIQYNETDEKYAELHSQAGKLEEELRISRILQTLSKYPSDAEDFPLDYVILLLRGIRNHFQAKEIKTKS